ncbi:hypothetical protein TNCV_4016551 [Trichonephila clavipes]|nr:hypothetical protein TNCV_4016551 [Trichonephila clavipes]
MLIHQLTIQDPFSLAHGIQSQLTPGAGGSMYPQHIRNKLYEDASGIHWRRFTADRYVTEVVEPVVLPLLQGEPNTVFQQDYSRPHVVR